MTDGGMLSSWKWGRDGGRKEKGSGNEGKRKKNLVK